MKRNLFLGITICAILIVASILSAPRLLNRWGQVARKQWKEEAIPQIAKWAADTNWTAQQVNTLTNGAEVNRHPFEGWLSDNLVLMGSGEWLVYKNHCSKEKPRLVKDIFLAKGSNGKWYYSTFHFCVGMLVLRMDLEFQPPDLQMFVHEYNLKEFDGSSDECLKETGTWPASWREQKQAQ